MPPNETPETSVKFVPVIVTICVTGGGSKVLPMLKLATVGNAPAGVTVNWSAAEIADVPEGVWTVTSTRARLESLPHGGRNYTAVIVPLALTVNDAAGCSAEQVRRWSRPGFDPGDDDGFATAGKTALRAQGGDYGGKAPGTLK